MPSSPGSRQRPDSRQRTDSRQPPDSLQRPDSRQPPDSLQRPDFLQRPDSQRRLREAGLRVTSPRIAVLEALDAADGHVTAEQVRRAVLARLGSVSVQTVYDTLAALTAAGLVRCLETPGHPARFETRVGDNHHHFICRSCGRTVDIDCAVGEAPCLTPRALPRGFEADEAEVTYWGTCSVCR